MSSYSHSTGSQQSTSVPQNMYSAETAASLAIANAAAALGQQTYQWATNTYNALLPMTTTAVNNFLQMSQYGLSLAQNQLNQYTQTYVPENQQLAQLAGTYSSTARQNVNMGAAESASMQGSQAGLNAASQTLQGFGIDPSSGMYGELQDAQRAAAGAAAAGAGQQAQLATQQTGRQLLGQSIQVGEQMPGDVVNSLNSAMQGVAGAENASLSTANTGAALMGAAQPYYNSAMQLKPPPVANTSQSTGTQFSQSNPNPNSGGGSSASSGNPYGSSPSSAGGYMGGQPTMQTGSYGHAPYSGGGGGGGGGGNSGIPSGGGGSIASIQSVPYGGDSSTPYTIPAGQGFGGGSPTQMGGVYGNYGSAFSGSGFAAGGAIPDSATTGGHVPQDASPSMGQETDDVPARLNANEFVIPRDVTEWKGREFFQKLIDQSRKSSMGATAKPSMGKAPAIPEQPRFVSHSMSGGAI